MKQFFGLVGLAFLFTCTLVDNNSTEFGFVRINNAILVDNISKPLPSKIKDIWLYADDQFLGVFGVRYWGPHFLNLMNYQILDNSAQII